MYLAEMFNMDAFSERIAVHHTDRTLPRNTPKMEGMADRREVALKSLSDYLSRLFPELRKESDIERVIQMGVKKLVSRADKSKVVQSALSNVLHHCDQINFAVDEETLKSAKALLDESRKRA